MYVLGMIGREIIVIEFLNPVLSTGLIIWGQANLNRYWEAISRGKATRAGTGAGEILISIGGAILFTLLTVFLLFPETEIFSLATLH